MERKNTSQLSLACSGNLRDNRQPRRLGSVLPSSNAIIELEISVFYIVVIFVVVVVVCFFTGIVYERRDR